MDLTKAGNKRGEPNEDITSHTGDSHSIEQHQDMSTPPTTKTTETLTPTTVTTRTPTSTNNSMQCTVNRDSPDDGMVRPHHDSREHDAIDTTNTTYGNVTVVRPTTTTTSPKSTTCALSHNPSPGTLCNTQNPPLDATMARAVETLQICHPGTIHDMLPATTSPWTLVTKTGPGKKAPADTTTTGSSHKFGLAFERTTKGNNWSTDDLLLILQTIQAHDLKAMLSSADNKTRPTLATAILHKAQKDIPWFTKFTAMKTMTWGKPSDGTTKIVFSFWLTSTIIKKDLAQLRMDSDFTEMLKGTNTYMKVTNALR